jgi:hypothetical protein
MQVDMHFYGTYAIARIAGFSSDQARTIATAAEFVDEAVAAEPVEMNGLTYVLPVVSAHRMYDLAENSNVMDQWRVWLPFHFLPGGYGNRVADRVVCAWGEPDNVAVESIIKLALDQKVQRHDLHMLGIVTHVLQDTYAHYGFSGFATDRNRIRQSTLVSPIDDFGDLLNVLWGKASGALAEGSRLGHASVSTCPDIPHLSWRFRYEERPAIPVDYDLENRDNQHSFYLSCTRLHALYRAFLAGAGSIGEPDGHAAFAPQAEASIKAILAGDDNDKDGRSELWRERIEADGLFPVSRDDRDLQYDDAGWRFDIMRNNAVAATTHAYQFNQAAARYLDHVHNQVLPGLGILSN